MQGISKSPFQTNLRSEKMKKICLSLIISFIGLMIFACMTNNVPPGQSDKSQQTSQDISGTDKWKADWDNVLKEAKKEGKVSIYSGLGVEVRHALSEGFGKKY